MSPFHPFVRRVLKVPQAAPLKINEGINRTYQILSDLNSRRSRACDELDQRIVITVDRETVRLSRDGYLPFTQSG